MKVVKVAPIMTVAESDACMGKMLSQDDCKTLFEEDVDVYDKESGKCIAKFRKGVIAANLQKKSYDALLTAAKVSLNRGTAGGGDDKGVVRKMLRSDGSLSKTSQAVTPVNSGIIGYFDRNPRMPFCRKTAFTQQHWDKFKDAYPIIKLVDNMYAKLMPEYYKKQRAMANKTSPDFVIKNTAFTTVTVNKDYQTAVHKDSGDFKGGFGNLVALRKGKYLGGHFVLHRWGVGFDLQNGDLLLCDVHQNHGNTPIIKENKKVTRLSLVMYYREYMYQCGTVAQELKRAKGRKAGDPVRGEI